MYYLNEPSSLRKYYRSWKENNSKISLSTDKYELHYKALVKNYRSIHPYHFVKEGDTVISAGCHDALIKYGSSQPLIFSALVGESGKVIVIEPSPNSLKCLRKYAKRYNVTNLVILDCALWSKNKKLGFNFHDGKLPSGVHSIRKSLYKDIAKPTPVEGKTLNTIIKKYGTPDIINLAINGSEYEALQGFDFDSYADIPIFMDIPPKNSSSWSPALFSQKSKALTMLEDNGYDISIARLSPRPCKPIRFHFAVSSKNKDLLKMGYKEMDKKDIIKLL